MCVAYVAGYRRYIHTHMIVHIARGIELRYGSIYGCDAGSAIYQCVWHTMMRYTHLRTFDIRP